MVTPELLLYLSDYCITVEHLGIHARRTFIRSAVRILVSPDNCRSAVICFKCKTAVRGTYYQSF